MFDMFYFVLSDFIKNTPDMESNDYTKQQITRPGENLVYGWTD